MDSSSFKKIFDIHYLPLCMYSLRLIGNKEEAEDIVVRSFSSAFEKMSAGKEISDLKSYLYISTRNLSYSYLRDSSHCDSHVPTDDMKEVAEEEIDTSERDARLWNAIKSLPERCRIVFLMSKRDGYSNSEIAEELGISVKTVENQMTKAFSRLRESLAPKGRKVFFLPFL